MTKYIFAFTITFIVAIGMLPVTAKEASKAKLDIRPEAKAMREAVAQTCQSCHVGQGKNVKKFGDFFEDGVLQKYVDRRDPKNSLLYKKIASKEMPKDDNGDELDDTDRAEFLKVIEKWIVAGTPSLEGNKEIDFVSPKEILETIANDLKSLKAKKVSQDELENFRYFSFLPIYNHGRRRANLPLFTQALSKLVNSLSWKEKIIVPKQIDRRGIVFRINLKDYGWNNIKWSDVVNGNYPHFNEYVGDQNLSDEIKNALNTSDPVVVRGDWFITQTSQPPFYHLMLDMPDTDDFLEREILSLQVSDNIFNAKVDRAGFVDSGVSQNNRIIERHTTKFGAYWKSYDFANSIQEKNIMERPLGPFLSNADEDAGATAFDHDGGEIIFNLPNGLQAYMLVTDSGSRIDKGPIQIVSDPSRPDRLVTNGVSCMGCHNRGIILKSDQINDVFASAPPALRARVNKFYGNPKFLNLMEKDQQVFLAAQGLAKVSQVSPEVVSSAVALYEGTIDRQGLAAELNLTKTELDAFVNEASQFSESLKSFYRQTTTSTIKRDSFDRFVIRDLSDVLASVFQKKIQEVQQTILKAAEDDDDSRTAAELVVRNQMSLDLYLNLRKSKFVSEQAQRIAKKGKAASDLAIKARKKNKNADLSSIVFFVESNGNEENLERYFKLAEKLSIEEALEISAKKDVDAAKYVELRSNEFDKNQALKIIGNKKFLAGTLTQLQRLGLSREVAVELAVDTDRAILAVEIISADQDSIDDILLLSNLAVKSAMDVKTYISLRKVASLGEARDAALLAKKKEISADKYIEFRKAGLEHADILKALKNDKFVIGNFTSLRSQGVSYELAFALAQDAKLAAAALKYLKAGNSIDGDLVEVAKLISEGNLSPETLKRLNDVVPADNARDAAQKISRKQFTEADYVTLRNSGLGHQETLGFLTKVADGKSNINVFLRIQKTRLADEVEAQEVAELVTTKKLTEKNYLDLRELGINHAKSIEFGKSKEGINGVQFIAKNSPDRGDDIVETATLWSKKDLDISKYLKIRKSPGVKSSKEARDAATQVEKQAIVQEFYLGLRKEGFSHPDALFLSTSNLLSTAATKLKLENTELSPASIRFLVDKINGVKEVDIPKFTWIMKVDPNFNMETAFRIAAPKGDEDAIFKEFLINAGLETEDILSILKTKTFLTVYQREMLKSRNFSVEEIIFLSQDVRGVKFLEDVKEVDRGGTEDIVSIAIAAGRKELDISTYGELFSKLRSRREAFDVAVLVKSKKLNKSDYLERRLKGISHREALKG